MTLVLFVGGKWNLDGTYTKEWFEKFFVEQNVGDLSDDKTKVDIGLIGVSLKTEQEYYVAESMKMYDIFTVRTYAILLLQILLTLLLLYQIMKLVKVQDKKEQLSKDDLILFDEEEYVKM